MPITRALTDAELAARRAEIKARFENLTLPEVEKRRMKLIVVLNRLLLKAVIDNALYQYLTMAIHELESKLVEFACDGLALTSEEVRAIEDEVARTPVLTPDSTPASVTA